MGRVASVWLPMWRTDRLRQKAGNAAPQDDVPLVVAGRVGNRRVVTAADAAAQALGLSAGMPVSTAQALVPGLVMVQADPKADAESFGRLAVWVMQRVSLIVAPDPPGDIVLDTTGADHLQGGEATMLEALVGRLVMSGVTARAAVADSWGAAHALARHMADPVFLAPGTAERVLAPLPIQALRLPLATIAGLRTLGFTRTAISGTSPAPRSPAASARTSAAGSTRRWAQWQWSSSPSAPKDLSRCAGSLPSLSPRPRSSPVTFASWSSRCASN
ncbi:MULTISPECIES: DNA polymerase Y family protein [unclassified Paracoccus (in: a-proteobacteria)]|nr:MULTISPECIES: DNA polymerase Y family protein [unclassified Paracoccus (in: a-proteobacteria)]